MFRRTGWLILFILYFFCGKGWCQQDVTFHINQQLLIGKNVLKAKRDIFDQYVWVLTQNNGIFRINSQTFAVDDYTSIFATYSTDQLIDISGYDQNNVFVATSSNVIAFENGIFSTIGAAQGLTGTVNSIGMGDAGGIYPRGHLLIGGSNGFGDYTIASNQLYFGTYSGFDYGPTKVFASTYRTQMFTNINYTVAGANNYPTVIFTQYDGYSSYIYHTSGIDNKINTAWYTLAPTSSTGIYNASSFWGNENGLFQQSVHWDGPYDTNTYQFLNGIQVNAIADILGLTNFNDPQVSPPIDKDNLLVGTNNGLYFSNSLYNNIGPGVSVFSLFHYDEIGSIPINDISVNVVASVANAQNVYCENGVWVSTTKGLYYIIPDYAKYFDPKTQLKGGIYYPLGTSSDTSNINLCSGSSISLAVNSFYIYSNSIQWQKNGQDIIGQTSPTLSVDEGGDYSAIIYDPCENVSISTNHLMITTVSGPIFTFNYPPIIQNCNANPVPLTVTGDPSYQYRWYTNGVLNGNTSQTFTATTSGEYYVEVSACTNSWVPSSKVQVSLVNLPVPAITSDKPTYCQGDAAMLSAGVPVDQSYTINWFKDGALLSTDQNFPGITTSDPGNYTVILTGTGSTCTQSSVVFPLSFTPPPIFTFGYPASLSYCAGSTQTLKVQGNPAYQYQWYNGGTAIAGENTDQLSVTQPGIYSVQVSSCPGSWVQSSTVSINFIQTPVPNITTDKPSYCVGDNATLSVNVIPDPTITVNWYRDNLLLPEFDGDFSITTNLSGTYTAAVVGNQVDANGNVCSSLSSPVVIGFNPAQVINIQQTANNGLCAGQTVTLKAIYNTGTIQWSTGETADEINVTTSGIYTVTLTTLSGCTATISQTVAFLPLPVLNVRDTAVCFYKNETATLTAPAGFAQYNWDNKSSGQTYTATQPGTLTLTVTDANGCQATQKIQVADLCPEVDIPNTFTPNGDNVNDTWVIQGLDVAASVKIFNRYGALLYKNSGYYTPWDGTYNGKKVPTGVYYYIIDTKSGNKKYSGSLTILY